MIYDLWFWCVCICIYSLCKSSLLTPFDGCLFHIQELRTCSSVSTPRLKCVRELIVPELHFDSICNWLQQRLCGGKTIWRKSLIYLLSIYLTLQQQQQQQHRHMIYAIYMFDRSLQFRLRISLCTHLQTSPLRNVSKSEEYLTGKKRRCNPL